MIHARPLVQSGPAPEGALPLCGGPLWFSEAELLERGAPARFVAARDLPSDCLDALTAPRAPIAGLDLSEPRIMGILNVTVDSFSDGGRHFSPGAALTGGVMMVRRGADIIDVGGESTRPGAAPVPAEIEARRTSQVIAAIHAQEPGTPISIDTRKAAVVAQAADAGASIVNDVSGLEFDPELAPLCAERGLPVCVMHAQGDPLTMQDAPHYDDVVLDVYDYLAARLEALEAMGIPRARMMVDPGIGFGKTKEHNLALLRSLSLFHGLGCAILLGVSRKRFIGTVAGEAEPRARMPGSLAVGLAGLAQGVQILRVHDVAETVQAVRLWQAVR